MNLVPKFYAVSALVLAAVFFSAVAVAFDEINIHSQSVRSLGAAGAYVGIADDPSAFMLNPAGLSRNAEVRRFEFQNHFVNKFNRWALSGSLIDGITEDPIHWGFRFNTIHTRSLWMEQYSVGTSFNYQNFILLGVSNNLYHSHRHQGRTPQVVFGVNAGALVFVTDYLGAGVSVQNALRTKSDKSLAPVRFSGGPNINFKALRVSLEAERSPSLDKTIGRLGVEVQSSNRATLRGGYFQDRKKTDMGYTVGATLQPDPRFHIDVALLDQLKSSQFIVSVGLGIRL